MDDQSDNQKVSNSGRLDPDFMFNLFNNGVIGTKEFRNWLAKADDAFAQVRDSDVDNEIDALARQRAEALRANQIDNVKPINRDGVIVGD